MSLHHHFSTVLVIEVSISTLAFFTLSLYLLGLSCFLIKFLSINFGLKYLHFKKNVKSTGGQNMPTPNFVPMNMNMNQRNMGRFHANAQNQIPANGPPGMAGPPRGPPHMGGPHHQFPPQGYPGPGGFRPPMGGMPPMGSVGGPPPHGQHQNGQMPGNGNGQQQKPMNQTERLKKVL
jgi:hypothetical protein